jgi:hypothetical protein
VKPEGDDDMQEHEYSVINVETPVDYFDSGSPGSPEHSDPMTIRATDLFAKHTSNLNNVLII